PSCNIPAARPSSPISSSAGPGRRRASGWPAPRRPPPPPATEPPRDIRRFRTLRQPAFLRNRGCSSGTPKRDGAEGDGDAVDAGQRSGADGLGHRPARELPAPQAEGHRPAADGRTGRAGARLATTSPAAATVAKAPSDQLNRGSSPLAAPAAPSGDRP